MKRLIYLFITLLVVASAADTATPPNNTKLADTVANVATILGDPLLGSTISALKELQTSSERSITKFSDGIGFKTFNSKMDHSYGAVKTINIDQLIKIWLSDSLFSTLPAKYKDILALAIKEYTIGLTNEAYHKQVFDITYNDGQGNMIMFWLKLTPHEKRTDALLWEKYVITTAFAPAPPSVVITETDCNIFSCDTDSQIVYLPAILTDSHINTVIQTNINVLLGFREFARNQITINSS